MSDSDNKDLEPAVGEAVPNLGARLRAAREAQGLSYEDISAELRIEPRSLKALEECRLSDLGAPVFAKGYIRQYAALLGLDAAELIDEYQRLGGQKPVEVEPSRTIKLRDDRLITTWIVTLVVLVGLIGYLVYWWLGQAA